MKQTALQELIEDVNRMAQGLTVEELHKYIIKRSISLLTKEKNQIENAFIDGKCEGDSPSSRSSDEYFHEEYRK